MYDFAGNQVRVRGHLELRTTFTDDVASRTANVKYLVVDAPSAYNIVLGRPALNRVGAIASTGHIKMKLPSLGGAVITIKSDQKEVKRCYGNNLKMKGAVSAVTTRPPRGKALTRAEITSVEVARGRKLIHVSQSTNRSPSGPNLSVRQRPLGMACNG